MHAYRILSTSRIAWAAAALALAMSFTGCKKGATSPASDATMTAALETRISSESALNSEPIQVTVQDSIATLNGTVSSEAARGLAAADAAQIPGIKTVVNNLTVQQPAASVATTAAPPPAPTQAPPPPRRPTVYKAKPAPVVRRNAAIEPPIQQAETAPPPPREQAPPPPPPPPRPPAPTFRDVTVTSGSIIPVRITQALDSATTQQGDTFTGSLASDIVIDGVVALRQGTPITGRVTAVQEAAHYKGSSLLSIELTSINRRGDKLAVSAEPYTVQGKGRGKNTAEKVGGGAAVGAILGGIFGGGKGAAIGAAAGGGVGAGANTITRGEQVQIPSESVVRFRLTNSIALRVSNKDKDTESTTSSPELQPRPADQPQ